MTNPNPLVDDTNQRIVQGLANGESPKAIALRLGIKKQTVYTRLQRLRDRLNATTNEHLVAIAFRARYIR